MAYLISDSPLSNEGLHRTLPKTVRPQWREGGEKGINSGNITQPPVVPLGPSAIPGESALTHAADDPACKEGDTAAAHGRTTQRRSVSRAGVHCFYLFVDTPVDRVGGG